MRVLGLGLAGCNEFCGLMDLASYFVSPDTHSSYTTKMCSQVITVAQKYFTAVVKEEKTATAEDQNLPNTKDLTASGDDTCMTRGFAALYGIVSLIVFFTGKVLDIFVCSSYCQTCKV